MHPWHSHFGKNFSKRDVCVLIKFCNKARDHCFPEVGQCLVNC